MKQRDFFRYISEFHHHLAVFTTYTIDWDVVEKLREHSTARTLILHDKMKGRTASKTYGSRLAMRPAKRGKVTVHYPGIFHAKVGLLIGESMAAICIGSLNLSRESFDRSKNVCAWVEVERDSPELGKLTGWLSDYFPDSWEKLSDELKPSKTSAKVPENWRFVHNTQVSLSTQIPALIENEWKLDIQTSTCHIASPFWASVNYKKEVGQWLHALSTKQVCAYSRYNKAAMLFADENVMVKFPQKGKQKDSFHSKLIMFDWENEQMVLFVGSANFTHEGFFLSEKDGGNVECGLVIKLANADYVEIKRWFEEGWETPIKLTSESVDGLPREPSLPAVLEPYMWAELEKVEKGRKRIKLYVVAEEMPAVEAVARDKKTKKLTVEGNADSDIFMFSLSERFLHERDDEVFLMVKLNGASLEVPLFSKDKFEEAYYNDGCDIFKTGPHKHRPGGPRLPGALGGALGLKKHFVDPSDLEEFHRLWRDRFEALRYSSFFTLKHVEELDETLDAIENNESGKGLYVVFHLERLKSIRGNEKILTKLAVHREKFMSKVFQLSEEANKWGNFVSKEQ